MANKVNYLYDEEDVNFAPKEFVGLANSGVERNQIRRELNRKALDGYAEPIESLIDSYIPKRPNQTKLK